MRKQNGPHLVFLKMSISLWSIVALLSGCSGLSPTVSLPKGAKLVTIAFLPPEYPDGLAREKVDYVHNAVENELRNKGFVLIDRSLTYQVCRAPGCPEKVDFARRYLVDGFVSLKIDSIARRNFLAGYYNDIKGALSIQAYDGREIASVAHAESERGGLLFNTGQVVQAISTTVSNAKGDSSLLLDKFALGLVGKLPGPTGESRTVSEIKGVSSSIQEASAVSIVDGKVDLLGRGLVRICVEATPNSIAYIRVGQEKTSIPEVSQGRYCAVLFLDQKSVKNDSLIVDVRSPYGESIRKSFDIARSEAGADPLDSSNCRATEIAKVATVNANGRVSIGCSTGSCWKDLGPCKVKSVSVYGGASTIGPFGKILSVDLPVRQATSVKELPPCRECSYQLVAFDRLGVASALLPLALSESNPMGK